MSCISVKITKASASLKGEAIAQNAHINLWVKCASQHISGTCYKVCGVPEVQDALLYSQDGLMLTDKDNVILLSKNIKM